jgi:Tfp pilus assembly protein PilV
VLGSETGLTLIEVLVTAVIVILLGSAVATALISTTHSSGDQRLRSQADALATQDQERLRGLSDEQLNGLDKTRTQTVDAIDFKVRSVASFLDTTGGSSCTSQAAASYKTTSTVSWTEGFNSRTDTSVTEESLLARPVTGNLITQVNDETHQPLSGVTVATQGPSTQTGTSDKNGCVLFAGLTPGAYTVNLTDPGYVDPDGNASPPNNTANVTTSGVATPAGYPFEMGLAGSVAGTFITSTAGVGGEADGVSWLGSGALDAMSGFQVSPAAAPALAPMTSLTTGPLFPFDIAKSGAGDYTNNYAVWAGRCAQQQPPAATPRYSVIPGSVGQAQSVPEPLLALTSVTSTDAKGVTTVVKPDDVRLSFASQTGAACGDSWTPTLSSAATPATMPVTGWLAYPGQPYADGTAGTLSVCADYAGYKSSLPATNTSFTSPNPVGTIAITRAGGKATC